MVLVCRCLSQRKHSISACSCTKGYDIWWQYVLIYFESVYRLVNIPWIRPLEAGFCNLRHNFRDGNRISLNLSRFSKDFKRENGADRINVISNGSKHGSLPVHRDKRLDFSAQSREGLWCCMSLWQVDDRNFDEVVLKTKHPGLQSPSHQITGWQCDKSIEKWSLPGFLVVRMMWDGSKQISYLFGWICKKIFPCHVEFCRNGRMQMHGTAHLVTHDFPEWRAHGFASWENPRSSPSRFVPFLRG